MSRLTERLHRERGGLSGTAEKEEDTVRATRDAHAGLRRLRETTLDREAVLVLRGSMRSTERDEILSPDGTRGESLLYRRFRVNHDRNAGELRPYSWEER